MAAKKGDKSKASGGGRAKKSAVGSEIQKAGSAAIGAGGDAGDADGRSGRRVPIQLLVDYKAEGSYLFDFCKDLGAGGVFIQTTKPMPTGAAIDLTFTIPDSKETLNARGKVIWVQAPVSERKDLVAGMGVQFDAFTADQRRLLEEFVARYNGTKTAPAGNVATTGARKRAS
jgi:uncharacterized protein (TIGR02266 family)